MSAAAVTGILRDELGFDGVVITDDLAMGAVAQMIDVPTAARLALIAGADLLMVGGYENVVPSSWSLMAMRGAASERSRLSTACVPCSGASIEHSSRRASSSSGSSGLSGSGAATAIPAAAPLPGTT